MFGNRSEFMHHRKAEHSETVPKCKIDHGSCQFGITKCWVKHDEQHDDTENHNENKQDVIDKLFNIVEQCTERIVQLENKT